MGKDITEIYGCKCSLVDSQSSGIRWCSVNKETDVFKLRRKQGTQIYTHSCQGPWMSRELWGVVALKFSSKSAHRWRWDCQPYTLTALSPRKIPVLIFIRGWVDPRATVQLEGLRKFWNRLTWSGIEPANLRLVAWRPNQLTYRVPRPVHIYVQNIYTHER
jgi:hypothetical protein